MVPDFQVRKLFADSQPKSLACQAVDRRFSELLAMYLKRRGITATALAERTSVSQTMMSNISLGRRPPDIDHLDGWADELQLVGDERDEFVLVGALENTPKPVRDRLTKLETLSEDQGRQIQVLNEAYDRLLRQLRLPPASPAPQ